MLPRRAQHLARSHTMEFRQQHALEVGRGARGGVEVQRVQVGDVSPVRDEHAEHFSLTGDGHVIDHQIPRVRHQLENRRKGHVEPSRVQSVGQAGGHLERNLRVVPVDERLGVQIAHAADARFR